jgi:hypothetical protein
MSGLRESGHGETLAYSIPSATAQSPRLIQRVGEAAKMPDPGLAHASRAPRSWLSTSPNHAVDSSRRRTDSLQNQRSGPCERVQPMRYPISSAGVHARRPCREFIGTYTVFVSLSKIWVVRFVSAVQNLAEECPGQQSPQPPAARMEAPPSPESPPEPVPATAAIAGPAP